MCPGPAGANFADVFFVKSSHTRSNRDPLYRSLSPDLPATEGAWITQWRGALLHNLTGHLCVVACDPTVDSMVHRDLSVPQATVLLCQSFEPSLDGGMYDHATVASVIGTRFFAGRLSHVRRIMVRGFALTLIAVFAGALVPGSLPCCANALPCSMHTHSGEVELAAGSEQAYQDSARRKCLPGHQHWLF
jgi:hypothetical protein